MKLVISMLIFAVVSLGCGTPRPTPVRAEQASEAFEARVAEVVTDEGRRQNIHAAVDEMRDGVRRSIEARHAIARRFVALHKDYDTPREDLAAILMEGVAHRAEFRQEIYAFRQTLIDNTTADEWDALEDAQEEALTASLVALAESPVELASELEAD